MKIFLDTANIDEIREAASLGVIDGVTTNPSLIAKEGRPLEDVAKEIVELVDGPISLEVVATDAKGMVEEGRALANIHKNITVKLPTVREGLKALNVLSGEGISVNMTLVFQASQALLVAKNGAAFVSPFVGRIDDISGDGMQLIADILTIYENYGFPTEVLVASVRHPLHIVEAALLGADVCTIPYKVVEQMLKHPLTDIGLKQFMADHKKTQG
jgi:transaldolase